MAISSAVLARGQNVGWEHSQAWQPPPRWEQPVEVATREPPPRFQSRVYPPARSTPPETRHHSLATLVSPRVDRVDRVAEDNRDLADQLQWLDGRRRELQTRVQRSQENLQRLRGDYESVRDKLHQYGLTPTIGLLLRHHRQQLDSWQTRDNELHVVRNELDQTQQQLLELELLPIADEQAPHQTGADARQRNGLIRQLKTDFRDYYGDLNSLDSNAQATAAITDQFRQLIKQNVTWIRSDGILSSSDIGSVKAGLATLFQFRHTRRFGSDISQKLSAEPGSAMQFVAIILFGFLLRWRLKTWLIAIGQNKKLRDAGPVRLVAAGGLTLALAAVLPAMGYLMARWLISGMVSEILLQVSAAMMSAALITAMVELPRQLYRPMGLLDKHMSTSADLGAAMRSLTIAGVVLVPATAAIMMLCEIDRGVWRDSLGRLTFLATMAFAAWTAHRACRPHLGYLLPMIATLGGRLGAGFGTAWYGIGIGFPLVMAVLSVAGYGHTTNELIHRAATSVIIITTAVVLWRIVPLGLEILWQRLSGTTPVRTFDQYGPLEQAESMIDVDQTRAELKYQLGFLVQCVAGIALVWILGSCWMDVMPHAAMFNPVLWTIADASATADSVLPTTTSVTLVSILAAGGVAFVTIQLAKLLPNLFDVLILQRVDYDEGMEHLILVVGRAIVLVAGSLIVCRWLGLRWATVHWLAVGGTVGIGFGLQDMVRNLVGGIIVLFARPVSVGDHVTVGEHTGRIAAQTLRSTVMTDDEGRQLLIPNKRFLSDDVTNWRGAGKLTTVSMEVTTGRESRSIDVARMLQGWAAELPQVLVSPSPQVTLVCVAKQTQRFEVHVWIEQSNAAHEVEQTLLRKIRDNLRDAGLLAKTQPSPLGNHDDRTPRRAKFA